MTSSPEPRPDESERPAERRRAVRSYVQRSARLGPRLQRHWDEFSSRYLLDLPRGQSAMSIDPDARIDLSAVFGRTAPTILEIGSGRGEMIAAGASQLPDTDLIACEVYTPGVAGILGRVGRAGLENVRIAHGDAISLLTTALPEASLDELWVFFPDPWHKTRHHKRRLINDDFARLAARVLRPGGVWRIATDWTEYANQISQVLSASPDFEGGPSERFDLRPQTRFETKAADEGRGVTDFTAVRRTPTLDDEVDAVR